MDRVPRDVLAVVVECLLPCERRAARSACWAWRMWPTRPRCGGCATTTTRRRPGPVINVRFPITPVRADPLLQAGRWWGDACKTIVLDRDAFEEHNDDPTEVAAWLCEVMVRLVPLCEFVVVWEAFTDRLQTDPLPRGVAFVISDSDGPCGASVSTLAELARSSSRPLAPWGRVDCFEIPDDLDRSRHLVSTYGGSDIDWKLVCQAEEHSQSDGGNDAFWVSDAPATPFIRCLEYTASDSCESESEAGVAVGPNVADATLLSTAARRWPALRELHVSCGRDSFHELAESEAAHPETVGSCIQQLAMVVEHAPLLRVLFVSLLTNAELRLLCEAVGRRRVPFPVKLFFKGTSDQLFSIVLGCVGHSARLARGSPLLGRRLLLGGVYVGGGPQKGVLRRLVRVFESNGPAVRVTVSVLGRLTICPADHEATPKACNGQRRDALAALRIFVGLPKVDFRDVLRHCHRVWADEFRSCDLMG